MTGCCACVSAIDLGDSGFVEFVENALGSKFNGDVERRMPLACVGGNECGVGFSNPAFGGTCGVETGESEAARLSTGSSLRELVEASSGLAIRRPPRDWERLKSPSMEQRALCPPTALAATNDGGSS